MASEVHRSSRRSGSPAFDLLDRENVIAQHAGSNLSDNIRPIGSGIILNKSTEKEESVRSRLPQISKRIDEGKQPSKKESSPMVQNIYTGGSNDYSAALELAKFKEDAKVREEERKLKREEEARSQTRREIELKESIKAAKEAERTAEPARKRSLFKAQSEARWNEGKFSVLKNDLELPDETEKRVRNIFKDQSMKNEQNRKNKANFEIAKRRGEMEGAIEAHEHVRSKLTAGARVFAKNVKEDFVNPVTNTARDIIENPDNQEKVKKFGKAIKETVHDLNNDFLAYGQAKAIMNGTADYSEEPVFNKEGQLVGYKRVFKQRSVEGNKKTNFGLKPPVQHNNNKPGPKTHRATLGKKEYTLGTGEKRGIGYHRRSGVKLVKSRLPTLPMNDYGPDFDDYEEKGGIGYHPRSGVKLVKSSLPALPINEGKGGPVNNTIYKPGPGKAEAKEPIKFEQKNTFHPINKNHSRAPFESTIEPQENVWKK